MGKLSSLSVKTINKTGRHGDGDGLYLNVAPSRTRSWVQRIVIKGKRRDIGLGSYSAVSLAQARSLAAANRPAVSEGRSLPWPRKRKPEKPLGILPLPSPRSRKQPPA